MPSWILFTLFAATMQATRTGLQKRLSNYTGATATTLARYIFALPFAWAYLLFVYSLNGSPRLDLSAKFFWLATAASISQIIATVLMVKLFTSRNYAVGVGYAKTEAILIAIIGSIIYADYLNSWAWLSVILGVVGLLIFSPVQLQVRGIKQLVPQLLSSTAASGLACGLGFALTALWIRQAGLGIGDNFIVTAAVTLAVMITIQSLLLSGYMLICNQKALSLLFKHWRLAGLVGITGLAGSIGWFTAMTMENPALVKTLGQIEFVLTFFISMKLFKEKLQGREVSGIVLIAISIVCLFGWQR